MHSGSRIIWNPSYGFILSHIVFPKEKRKGEPDTALVILNKEEWSNGDGVR